MNIRKIGFSFVVTIILTLSGIGSIVVNGREVFSTNHITDQYVVIDTGQNTCYDDSDEMSFPYEGEGLLVSRDKFHLKFLMTNLPNKRGEVGEQ